ncbi:MAG: hypothetical protein ACOCVF_00340 [bacterium]
MEFLKNLKKSLDEGKVFNSEDIDKINEVTEKSKKYDKSVRENTHGVNFSNVYNFNEKNAELVKNNTTLDKIRFIMDLDDKLMKRLKELEEFLVDLNNDDEIKTIQDYEKVKPVLDEFNNKYIFRKNGNINIKFK